jgi:vancomycin resistance protein YoaR
MSAVKPIVLRNEFEIKKTSYLPSEIYPVAESARVVNLVGAAVSLVGGLLIVLMAGNSFYLNNRMLWHTQIGTIDIGGKTVSDARTAIQDHINEFNSEEVVLRSNEGLYLVRNTEFGPAFDIESALLKAFQAGHTKDARQNQKLRLFSLFSSRVFSLDYWFDETKFTRIITNRIPKLKNNQPQDASVVLSGKEFIAIPGHDGLGFDENKLIAQYQNILSAAETRELPIVVVPKQAEIDLSIAQAAKKLATRYSGRQLHMLYSYDGYNYDKWSVYLRENKNWFEFRKIKDFGNFNLYPVLNAEKLRNELNQRIAPYLYRAKEDITIKNENGKPAVEGVARDGYYLDVTRSIKAINDTLMANKVDTIGNFAVHLEVAHLIGGVANPDNAFGISDVLATGVTDFFGSPENRKFNINHASQSFQNVLIQPGDKFSFLKCMGKVDSTTGYEKELVIINGDSTVPQYGGGMCQVSSTLFRTVFFAGLKVIKRSSHSFEVKYYLPTGLDATVAEFAPDLVFENDTPNLVLVQNLVDLKRTKMYFKLFGKKDGRKLSFEGPINKGPVGEKNDHYMVAWIRHIDFPDGKARTDKFNSVYINKELVKKYQPENLLVKKDSTFVPVSYDTTKSDRSNLPSNNH